MKKLALITTLLIFISVISGCTRTDKRIYDSEESSELTIIISETSSYNSETESSSASIEPTSTESTSTTVTIPVIEDIPAEITGIHDFSTGNYIYNPNVLDTSNKRRYNGDFNWTNERKVLWTSTIDETPWNPYDADGAVTYGKANWNNGIGLCAEFLSSCLTRGGNITNYTDSSTAITLMLLHSRLGFGQFLPYNKEDNTITLPEYARPGDVVQLYCTYEGVMMHSTLFVGTDDKGRMRAVAHNLRNSGENTFLVDYLNDPCWCCKAQTAEVFFYHFYHDDDKGLPEEVINNKDIVLWEERGYTLPNETFDRASALEYAKSNPKDGLGWFGADNTSKILRAGGCSAGYLNQSAVFLQLLKTHLGAAESLSIRDDRTVILPNYAKAGDMAFVYCPDDGMIISSFIISDKDEYGRMIAESYDLINDGKSAFKVDSWCPGCGADVSEVILYHFDE